MIDLSFPCLQMEENLIFFIQLWFSSLNLANPDFSCLFQINFAIKYFVCLFGIGPFLLVKYLGEIQYSYQISGLKAQKNKVQDKNKFPGRFSKCSVYFSEELYICPFCRQANKKYNIVSIPNRLKKYQNVIYIGKFCHQF